MQFWNAIIYILLQGSKLIMFTKPDVVKAEQNTLLPFLSALQASK
jgi:hypothetical protein